MHYLLAHGGRITWDEILLVLTPLVLLIAAFVLVMVRTGPSRARPPR